MSDRTSLPAIEGGTPVRDAPLPFYRAPISDADVAAVVDTLRSGWLTVGPKTEAFEQAVADYVGAPFGVAVSSCSEGMLVALKAVGVEPGDEVITSPLTFASTVHAIIHAGATPVLADIEDQSFGVDPECVRAAVSPRTRALLPVHFGGQACRIDDVMHIAGERGLSVVEDAAHAFGAEVNSRRVGTAGDATVFSFYATKNLTTGEGGAVTTEDEQIASHVRRLSYHGMSRDAWKRYADRGSWYYEVIESGYKSNLNDIQAALGLSQLARFDELIAKRRAAAARLTERLRGCEAITLPTERSGNLHTWHLYVIQLRTESLRIDRNRFVEALHAENIATSVHFIPIHQHPFWTTWEKGPARYPVCDAYAVRCLSLPLFPGMSPADCDDVAEAVHRIAAYYSEN